MKRIQNLRVILFGSAVLIFGFNLQTFAQAQVNDQLHTPAKDSAERQAILDAVRNEYKEGADHPAKFLVNYLKVHNGWAWINVTPLDANGKPVGDPAPLLFNNADGKWISKDLFEVPTDPDDHVGPLDPSPKFIKALQQKYPGVPADIIPKKSR